MMRTVEERVERCENEGCARPAEPGERYCVVCDLERTLYQRDARRPLSQTPLGREADRR